MPIRHTVRSGECMTTIAFRYGFKDYHAIYDHPDNAELKQNRPNPNVLAPGDVVVVPDREMRTLSLAVDSEHRVKVHRPKKELRIVFKNAEGEPLKSEPYTFQAGTHDPVEGTTDGSGTLKEPVPIGTTRALVTIQGRTLRLSLGALAPLKATPDEGANGVRARLRNLGYNAGQASRSGIDRTTRTAIAIFQHDEGGTVDGALTDELRTQLSDQHGS